MGRDTGPAHTADPSNAREQWRGMEPAMSNDLIDKPAALTNAVQDSYLFSPEEVESRGHEREYGLDQLEIDQM
jgi:hypothetical protein